MDDLREAYEDYIESWQNIAVPGGFACFQAGYYHGKKTGHNSECPNCGEKAGTYSLGECCNACHHEI